jgi:hypothetical protein
VTATRGSGLSQNCHQSSYHYGCCTFSSQVSSVLTSVLRCITSGSSLQTLLRCCAVPPHLLAGQCQQPAVRGILCRLRARAHSHHIRHAARAHNLVYTGPAAEAPTLTGRSPAEVLLQKALRDWEADLRSTGSRTRIALLLGKWRGYNSV